MATETVTIPDAASSEGATFFDLNARYVIAPGATLVQLFNDCKCLLSSGMGAIGSETFDDFTSAQWAGVYMLRQAEALFDEIYRRSARGEA